MDHWYEMREARNFGSMEELTNAYFKSPYLEVRAGIVHDLVKNMTGVFHSAERVPFLLMVCSSCVEEAHELHLKETSVQYPEKPSEEEYKKIDKEKAGLKNRERQLIQIAQKCIVVPMGIYTGRFYPGHLINESDMNVREWGEKVLFLISNKKSAPYIFPTGNTNGPTKEAGKFLETYMRENKTNFPDAWFQAVIYSYNLHILREQDRSVVKSHLLRNLKDSIAHEKIEEEDRLLFSRILEYTGTRSKFVAKALCEHLAESGELDATINLS
jgi:hypothetical protein